MPSTIVRLKYRAATYACGVAGMTTSRAVLRSGDTEARADHLAVGGEDRRLSVGGAAEAPVVDTHVILAIEARDRLLQPLADQCWVGGGEAQAGPAPPEDPDPGADEDRQHGEEGKRDGIRAKVSSWRRISSDSLIPHAVAATAASAPTSAALRIFGRIFTRLLSFGKTTSV